MDGFTIAGKIKLLTDWLVGSEVFKVGKLYFQFCQLHQSNKNKFIT